MGDEQEVVFGHLNSDHYFPLKIKLYLNFGYMHFHSNKCYTIILIYCNLSPLKINRAVYRRQAVNYQDTDTKGKC